jgi:integrase
MGHRPLPPLSSPALAVIANLPEFKDCPWLIPNPDTLQPFVSIKHSWKTAIKVAKLPGLRIHDLRHSAASFMVNSGVDLFAVGKVLGHASYQSTQRTVTSPMTPCWPPSRPARRSRSPNTQPRLAHWLRLARKAGLFCFF